MKYDYFSEILYIEAVPKIFIIHEGEYYPYQLFTAKGEDDTYDSIAGILHMINRLQHPLLPLNTEEAIEQFLDTSIDVVETTGFLNQNKDNKQVAELGDFYMKLKYKTRVLVFTYEKEDFEEEIKTLKKVGRLLS